MSHYSHRVALVHDFINQWGGAEQVLETLSMIYSEAPIYTLFFDLSGHKEMSYQGSVLGQDMFLDVHESIISKFPRTLRQSRLLSPMYPTQIENFNFENFDLVLSDSSSFAKGIITRPETIHINYCHSPTRYLWDYSDRYVEEGGFHPLLKNSVKKHISKMRHWDYLASDRVDYFIANSKNVQDRIKKYYQRDSRIIYPPIQVLLHESTLEKSRLKRGQKSYTSSSSKRPYFLFVGRLSKYKHVEIAVEAMNRLQERLIVIGTGREEESLKKQGWSNITFTSSVSREKLDEYYRGAKALIMPAEEDFGMVMVEAMSFGKPVIAYKKGGALEIIHEGKNGEFFSEETPESLMEAIRKFNTAWEDGGYNEYEVFESVKKFDEVNFVNQISSFVDEAIKKGLPNL